MAMSQDIIYPYVKQRKDFGKQPQCIEDHPRVHIDIQPDKRLHKKLRRMVYIDKATQAVPVQAEDEINTTRATYEDRGFYHVEGGWPKDINHDEPEMMNRYRKKLEKEEAYGVAMTSMLKTMEKYIKQNNAMDIYSEFFDHCWEETDTHRTAPYANIVQVYRDPAHLRRAIARITWAPDNVGRIGIAHCPHEFDPTLRQTPTEAFIWDLENSNRPESLVRNMSHICDLRYNPKDIHCMIGGCFNGTICLWDARVGPNPVDTTPVDISHQDLCTNAIWINSKTGTEFFSGGLDGQIIWWDSRKMNQIIENTWLDPEKGQVRAEAAIGCSVLEYEHTVPTKFMAGTEAGSVMIMMKKGKNPNEKLVHTYQAHRGPIRALQRNPMFIKNILTVGDSTCRIFAEDVRESSIMWTAPKDTYYTHGAWIPTRASSWVCCRMDGHCDFWDLLMDAARPNLTVKVCDDSLTCLAPAENGKYVAVGTEMGYVSLLKLADGMTTSEKNDKPALAAIFERESRREKFIEQRNREIRLRKRDKEKQIANQKKEEEERIREIEAAVEKAKEKGEIVKAPDLTSGKEFDIEFEARHDPIVKAEREFFVSIRKEIEEKGIDAFPDKMAVEEEEEEQAGEEQRDSLDITTSMLMMQEEAKVDDDEKDKEAETKAAAPVNAQPDEPAEEVDDTKEDDAGGEEEEGEDEGEEEEGEEEEMEENDGDVSVVPPGPEAVTETGDDAGGEEEEAPEVPEVPAEPEEEEETAGEEGGNEEEEGNEEGQEEEQERGEEGEGSQPDNEEEQEGEDQEE